MHPAASSFHTSEITASFVTSIPLLSVSWRLCNLANTTSQRSFVTEQIGNVGYVAFSSVQEVQGLDSNSLVALDCPVTEGPFLSLKKTFSRRPTNGKVEQDPPVMVHGGMLHQSMSLCMLPNFRNQAIARACQSYMEELDFIVPKAMSYH